MGWLDALWHLLNFAAPAPCVAGGACLGVGWVWRRPLAACGRPLTLKSWGWASAAGLLALVAGLVVFGRDGKMATYAALVLSVAGVLWWCHVRHLPLPGAPADHPPSA